MAFQVRDAARGAVRSMYEHVFVMSTRERVLDLRATGLSLTQVARELGLVKSTVAYHVRRAGEVPDPRFNRRYDWAEVQAFLLCPNCHSQTDNFSGRNKGRRA